MKTMRLTTVTLLCWLSFLSAVAQVTDAFQGILPVTDPAMKRSLNGMWQIKVVQGTSSDVSVPPEDATWSTIPVPGCWEAHDYCLPTYDRADTLTGYYRTEFTIPAEWRGQQIVLRLDGVLYGYDLWVNDRWAGAWRSGYNTALFDITSCIDPDADEQRLSMRVLTQFRGSAFDYNDDWTPSGISRDVTLMAVPRTHLSDLTIIPQLSGQVQIHTEVANASRRTRVRHEILDASGQVVGTDRVKQPHLWSAETPYLYTLRTTLMEGNRTLQTFTHKFGFRSLTIDGNVLKLNGQPIKLRGVTCHSTDPVTAKVIDEASMLRDMRLMKEASVNYIRTSHYPREPRFYELADSLGFYVIDEVPFGFGDRHLHDSTFYPILQQRAQATVRRDKNHPSVLLWSLGNENPLTDICVRLGEYVKAELDSSRMICYPQVGSYFRRFNYQLPEVADVYAPHYPTTAQLSDFYQRADRPVIFTEYCHSLGISFEDHDRQWSIIERTPCLAGGSVWEWVDQGMPFCDTLSSVYGYTERVYTSRLGGFEMNGNKGADGLLYADRTPLPNYYELQHNYARARVVDVNGSVLRVTNGYDFVNLKDYVTFHWALTQDRDTVLRGAFSPDCAPHDTVQYQLDLPQLSGLVLLHVTLTDREGSTFLRQSFVMERQWPQWSGSGDAMDAVQEGPLLRVGRKPTMAEGLRLQRLRIEQYLQNLDNPYVQADVTMQPDGSGTLVRYRLQPDTTSIILTELGVAYLLDSSINRIQWIGQGPYASYPGRCRANRYGVWSKQLDDLYLEGNRMGVDAALLTDSLGNGLLVVADSMSLSFEQTDRGLVLTVNAAVSGQGPKFARTAFPVISSEVGVVQGQFHLYRIEAGRIPSAVQSLFAAPDQVPAPFHPFLTQYDTYLLRYNDIRP